MATLETGSLGKMSNFRDDFFKKEYMGENWERLMSDALENKMPMDNNMGLTEMERSYLFVRIIRELLSTSKKFNNEKVYSIVEMMYNKMHLTDIDLDTLFTADKRSKVILAQAMLRLMRSEKISAEMYPLAERQVALLLGTIVDTKSIKDDQDMSAQHDDELVR